MAESVLPPLPFELNSIYIRSSRAELASQFNPTIAGQQLAGEFRMSPSESPSVIVVGPRENPTTTLYSFVSLFEFRYIRDLRFGDSPTLSVDESVCASIATEIAVEYILHGTDAPDDASLKAWGGGPALNHAWPYWREFCHSTMTRMHLPISMVPLLNITPRAADEANIPNLPVVSEKKKPRSRKSA